MSILKRVRGAFSGYQADVDPHNWRLPTDSQPTGRPDSERSTPIIPDPKIFTNAFIPRSLSVDVVSSSLTFPDPSHVAIHLALLECFRNLKLGAKRLEISADQHPPLYHEPDNSVAPASPAPQSRKWDVLVRLAVTRFATWWANIGHVISHAHAYTHHGGDKYAVQLTKDYLPPLDVLLVWYAFMQNGDAYDAACRTHEVNGPALTQVCFPWPAIREVIEMDTMQYSLPRAASNLFTTLTQQSAEMSSYLEEPPAYADAHAGTLDLDLFAEVMNTDKFIEAAHELLWIRAPSLTGSLSRAGVDYLRLQANGSGVDGFGEDLPFGIELTWRTHRLFPAHYRLFMQQSRNLGADTDIDLDIDMKRPPRRSATASSSDSEASGDSSTVWDACLCWTCERIRDDLPSFVHMSTPPGTSPKVPSPMYSQLSSLPSEKLRCMQDELGFHTAVERERASRGPLRAVDIDGQRRVRMGV
jgi:hypothetical protein